VFFEASTIGLGSARPAELFVVLRRKPRLLPRADVRNERSPNQGPFRL